MKSALEINQGKALNAVLRKNEKTSDQSLRSSHAESTSKLYNQLGRNLSGEVLSEVSKQNSSSSMFCHLNLSFKGYRADLVDKAEKETSPEWIAADKVKWRYRIRRFEELLEGESLNKWKIFHSIFLISKDTERRGSVPENENEHQHHGGDMKPIYEVGDKTPSNEAIPTIPNETSGTAKI